MLKRPSLLCSCSGASCVFLMGFYQWYFCFNLFLLSLLASCVICGKVRSAPCFYTFRLIELWHLWLFRFSQRFHRHTRNLKPFLATFSSFFFCVFWRSAMRIWQNNVVWKAEWTTLIASTLLLLTLPLCSHVLSSSAKPSENMREWTWHYSDPISPPQ